MLLRGRPRPGFQAKFLVRRTLIAGEFGVNAAPLCGRRLPAFHARFWRRDGLFEIGARLGLDPLQHKDAVVGAELREQVFAPVGPLHHGQLVVEIDHQRVAVLAGGDDEIAALLCADRLEHVGLRRLRAHGALFLGVVLDQPPVRRVAVRCRAPIATALREQRGRVVAHRDAKRNAERHSAAEFIVLEPDVDGLRLLLRMRLQVVGLVDADEARLLAFDGRNQIVERRCGARGKRRKRGDRCERDPLHRFWPGFQSTSRAPLSLA